MGGVRDIEMVYIKELNAWISVGGNTPWRFKGTIKRICMTKNDPRNFNGAESDFIFIEFDSGLVIEIKTSDYIIGYDKEVNN